MEPDVDARGVLNLLLILLLFGAALVGPLIERLRRRSEAEPGDERLPAPPSERRVREILEPSPVHRRPEALPQTRPLTVESVAAPRRAWTLGLLLRDPRRSPAARAVVAAEILAPPRAFRRRPGRRADDGLPTRLRIIDP